MGEVLAAAARWLSWRGYRSNAVWGSSDARSCGQIMIRVGVGSDLDRCVNDLGEHLRVVELLTRAGVDPLAFHRVTGHRDATQCPMGDQWCSFCDGADRRVKVRLVPDKTEGHCVSPTYLQAIRRAVFVWDEATGTTPSFHEIRAAVVRLLPAETTPRPPIELTISVSDVPVDAADVGRRELEALIARAQEADGHGLFRIASVLYWQRDPDAATLALLAASQIPLVIDSGLDLEVLVKDSDSGSSVLAKGNVTALTVGPHGSCCSPVVEQLYHTLHTHSSQLRDLTINHDESDFADDEMDREQRTAEFQVLARGLFSPVSTLRLDRLSLTSHLSQEDLECMIAAVAPLKPSTDSSDVGRHRSFVLWTHEPLRWRGATLGELLDLAGGVSALNLSGPTIENTEPPRQAFRIAEIPDLVRRCSTLRSLCVETTCVGWKKLLSASAVPRSQLDHLELRIFDRKSVLIASGAERLLSHVGSSLVSLSVLPMRSVAMLKPALAAAIVQHCPRLEELSVRNAEDDFVQKLLDSYGNGKYPCRLKRLMLVSGHADVEYDGLVAALSAPEHPVARALRSLHVDVRGWDDDDVEPLRTRLQKMLRVNDCLHDVTLCVSDSTNLTDDVDSAAYGWSTYLPPLRHRLAVLSALRRLNLPISVLSSILSLAGRRVRRFRFDEKEDEEMEYFEEDDD